MHMLATNYIRISNVSYSFRHDTFSQGVPKCFRQKVFILYYESNVVFCEVTGLRVNRGVGLGIEVSCVDKFYRSDHINKVEKLLRNSKNCI